MSKSIIRAYSGYTSNAVLLLGQLISSERKWQKLTLKVLAERAGISRGLLQRIEKGDMKCEIGCVFEVASLLGIKLFDADHNGMMYLIHETRNKLTLLPKSMRKSKEDLDDDF